MRENNLKRESKTPKSQSTRGEPGKAIAAAISEYTPRDLKRMQWNFSGKLKSINTLYRRQLEKTNNDHMVDIWEKIRLMNQQGSFPTMKKPLPDPGE